MNAQRYFDQAVELQASDPSVAGALFVEWISQRCVVAAEWAGEGLNIAASAALDECEALLSRLQYMGKLPTPAPKAATHRAQSRPQQVSASAPSLASPLPAIEARKPTKRFADLAGMTTLKEYLMDMVVYRMSSHGRRLFPDKANAKPIMVLMIGPPGGGKTTIAEAAAGEIGENCDFFPLSGAQLAHRLQGDSEKAIESYFTYADNNPNRIVLLFFDELDCVVSTRDQPDVSTSSSEKRSLAQLLTELTRSGRHNVVVIAATNKPKGLDDALMSRFDGGVLTVPVPSAATRRAFLRVFMPTETEDNINRLVERFDGISLRAIEKVFKEGPYATFRTNAWRLAKEFVRIPSTGKIRPWVDGDDAAWLVPGMNTSADVPSDECMPIPEWHPTLQVIEPFIDDDRIRANRAKMREWVASNEDLQ